MRTDDRSRLQRMLEQEKPVGEACMRAAAADFKRVAEEYFETDGGFVFTTRQGKQGLEIVCSFRIVRAKNFLTLR